MKNTPQKEAIVKALKNPNGWVYEIDKEYRNKEVVPRCYKRSMESK